MKKIFSYLCLLLSFILAIAALFFSAHKHLLRSDVCLTLALTFAILGFFFLLKSKLLNFNHILSLLLCYLPFAALYSLAMIRGNIKGSALYGTLPIFQVLGTAALIIPTIILLFLLIKNITIQQTYTFIKEHLGIILVCLIFTIFSLDTLHPLPLWDAIFYFSSPNLTINNWNLTLERENIFRMATHQSYAATIFYMIGAYLTPQMPAGLRIINILLTLSSIIFFYSIIIKLTKKYATSRATCAILTSLYAFNPLVLGTVYTFSLDFFLMVFAVWAISALLYRNWILLLFSLLVLTFSKENGITIAAGIGIGWFLSHVLAHLSIRTIFASFIDSYKIFLSFFLVAVVWGVLFIWLPRWTTADHIPFNFNNLTLKLKELYILNFSYLYVVLVILFLIKWIFTKKSEDWRTFVPIIFGYVFFVGSHLYTDTHTHARYMQPHIPFLVSFAIIAICEFFRNTKLLRLFSILFATLFFTQSFRTIDPLTRATFKNINVGSRTLITTAHNNLLVCDSIAYNREGMYLAQAFNKLLSDINYTKNKVILSYGSWSNMFSFITLAQGLVYKKSGILSYQKNKRSTLLNYGWMKSLADLSKYQQFKKIYLIYLPTVESFNLPDEVLQLETVDEGSSSYQGWQINWLRLK